MDNIELKVRCLEMAVRISDNAHDIIGNAEIFRQYAIGDSMADFNFNMQQLLRGASLNLEAIDTGQRYNIRYVLKGDKSWSDIFKEAIQKHPHSELDQAEYSANLMKEIGFDISVMPGFARNPPIEKMSNETIRKHF